jgi:hypothetical protein
MSYGTRNHVRHGEPGYLAVAYDAAGKMVGSMGPYATRGPAMAQRRHLLHHWRGNAAMVRVEVATPAYEPIEGTELVNEARRALAEALDRRSR